MPANQPHPTDDDRPRFEYQPWHRAAISKSYAYELMAEGGFPRPVKIGRAARFVSSEVDAWIAARIAERDTAARGADE